jgi:hypothetical protein
MQIRAISVIEYTGGEVSSIRSFSDDEEGRKEAEELFVKTAKSNGMDDADRDICLEDGLFEEGDYQVFLMLAKI